MAESREQEIRERAYRIWQDEGEPSGRDQDHWSQAQAEVEGATGRDGLIADSADDLPFGEPEDSGAADATVSDDSSPASSETALGAAETPQTSGIAAAAQAPVAPAPKDRKGKAGGKVSN